MKNPIVVLIIAVIRHRPSYFWNNIKPNKYVPKQFVSSNE